MSNEVSVPSLADSIERVLIKGDISQLTPEQKMAYVKAVCESVGLNPLTRPFEYIRMNGKEVLYAKRDATDQLRNKHKVSIKITSREKIGDVFQVTAQATDAQGRTDESIGAVTIGTLKGDALANALMKAETKAKRRVTLSICGLGLLDETEIETIPQQRQVPRPSLPPEALRQLEKEIKQTEELISHNGHSVEYSNHEPFPFEQEQGVSDSGYISQKQAKRLFAISKAANWPPEAVKELVLEITGQESSAKIPWQNYKEICETIENNPKNA